MRKMLIIGLDLMAFMIAALVASGLRHSFAPPGAEFRSLVPYFVTSLALLAASTILFGLDRPLWRFSSWPDYLPVAITSAGVVLGALAFCYLSDGVDAVPWSIPLLHFLLGVVLMSGMRAVVSALLARRPEPDSMALQQAADEMPACRGREAAADLLTCRTVLVIGLSRLTQFYLRSVAELAYDRIRVGGIVAHGDCHRGLLVGRHQVYDSVASIRGIMRSLAVHGAFVDRIVVTTPRARLPAHFRAELDAIGAAGSVDVDYLAERLGCVLGAEDGSRNEFLPGRFCRRNEEAVFDPALLRPALDRSYWRIKRLLDIVLSAMLLVLLAPLILAVAFLVVVANGSPALFWQYRPGRRGLPFKLFKFRTMASCDDIDADPPDHHARIDRVGRLLRATRLDELPQLWNILVGEMSFIGPRPLLWVDQSESYVARLLVRPGLTGWAQVVGGREIPAIDKAALDVWYIQNASVRLDLRIVLRTVLVVLRGERIHHEEVAQAWTDLRRTGASFSDRLDVLRAAGAVPPAVAAHPLHIAAAARRSKASWSEKEA